MSRRRSWRAISSAASRLVLSAVSSMLRSRVERPELTSIAVSASVVWITIEAPERSWITGWWRRVELLLDAVAVEQRQLVLVRLDPARARRHQHAHHLARGLVALVALDPDLVDVAAVEVADRALHQRALLVDRAGRDRPERQLADVVPQPQRVLVVALDLELAALLAGGADDQPHAFGDLELARDRLERASDRRSWRSCARCRRRGRCSASGRCSGRRATDRW